MNARPDPLRERAGLWYSFATDDLAAARAIASTGTALWTAAFHAQQAAEKGLKAVLVSMDVDPPHSHEIAHLRDVLSEHGEDAAALEWADGLTQFAVTTRYPRVGHQVLSDQATLAIEQAQRVLGWVRGVLAGRGVHVD